MWPVLALMAIAGFVIPFTVEKEEATPLNMRVPALVMQSAEKTFVAQQHEVWINDKQVIPLT